MDNSEILKQGRYHVISSNSGYSDFATDNYEEAKAKADEIAAVKHVAGVHDMTLDWNSSQRYLSTPHGTPKFSEVSADKIATLVQDEHGNVRSVVFDSMKNVFVFEPQPPAEVAKLVRDRFRANSPVYAHLLDARGIGEAERWINSLTWIHPLPVSDWRSAFDEISPNKGWGLHHSAESERIAQSSARAWMAAGCPSAGF